MVSQVIIELHNFIVYLSKGECSEGAIFTFTEHELYYEYHLESKSNSSDISILLDKVEPAELFVSLGGNSTFIDYDVGNGFEKSVLVRIFDIAINGRLKEVEYYFFNYLIRLDSVVSNTDIPVELIGFRSFFYRLLPITSVKEVDYESWLI